jgi:hypothetical protein
VATVSSSIPTCRQLSEDQQDWKSSRTVFHRRAKIASEQQFYRPFEASSTGCGWHSLLSAFNFSFCGLFQYRFTFLCPLPSTGYPRLISRGTVATFCVHDTLGHRAAFRPPQPKAPAASPDRYMCKPVRGYILV